MMRTALAWTAVALQPWLSLRRMRCWWYWKKPPCVSTLCTKTAPKETFTEVPTFTRAMWYAKGLNATAMSPRPELFLLMLFEPEVTDHHHVVPAQPSIASQDFPAWSPVAGCWAEAISWSWPSAISTTWWSGRWLMCRSLAERCDLAWPRDVPMCRWL